MLSKQLFLEKLNSPGRLPSLSSPLPSRGSSLSRARSLSAHLQPIASDTTITIAVALFICVFMLFALHGHLAADGRTATALGKRSWKDVDLTRSQQMEVQLVKRDEEIDALRLKLRNVLSSSRAAEANRASQESLITSLQQRHEAEKQHKYTAIYALAERSKALEECNTHEHQLREELANCREAGVVAAQKVL